MAEHANAPRCHHVKTNGIRCGSPAMRKNKHCYYHRQTLGIPRFRRAELTNLEDGNAIQLAIAHVVRQIDMGAIEYRAAHLKIDAYRLALRNLKNMNIQPYGKEVITLDPAFDPANAGLVEEPVTFSQQEELATRGAFAEESQETLAEPETDEHETLSESVGRHYLAQDVSPGEVTNYDSSPVGTAPELKRTAALESGKGKLFEHMTEDEREAYIMHSAGNHAYFTPEDLTKRPPESEATSLAELLKEALIS